MAAGSILMTCMLVKHGDVSKTICGLVMDLTWVDIFGCVSKLGHKKSTSWFESLFINWRNDPL